jgi:hypothetical protein
MLFGQSVFQSVVQRLKEEAEECAAPDDPEPNRIAVSGLNLGFVVDSAIHEPQERNTRADAYLDFLPEPPPVIEAEPEPMPAHLQRTSLEQVSEELAIGRDDTPASLAEKRRAFAKLNHPDRIHPDFRANAHLRMTAANLLIDQAIRLIDQ